ncbi:MAG: TAXI family TRAP transporter solute-binding subunit, partial [Gemmatimonadales bacterium]
MDRPRLLDRRSVLGLGAAAAAALVTPGCSRGRSDEPAPAGPATIVTGNAGGVYNKYGSGLAKLVSEVTGVQMTPKQTNGSVENLQMLAKGTADVGFCLSDSALDAWEGVETFKTGSLRGRFTALARTYDNYVHVVVPTSSDVFEIGQLAGKVVNIGPVGSGTRVVAERILKA